MGSNVISEDNWKYNIGDILFDKERNLMITDRKRFRKSDGYLHKFYKFKCLKCGYDCGEYYSYSNYYQEKWVPETDLARTDKRKTNCSCCSNRLVSPHINSVYAKKNKWMVDYFYDEEISKK